MLDADLYVEETLQQLGEYSRQFSVPEDELAEIEIEVARLEGLNPVAQEVILGVIAGLRQDVPKLMGHFLEAQRLEESFFVLQNFVMALFMARQYRAAISKVFEANLLVNFGNLTELLVERETAVLFGLVDEVEAITGVIQELYGEDPQAQRYTSALELFNLGFSSIHDTVYLAYEDLEEQAIRAYSADVEIQESEGEVLAEYVLGVGCRKELLERYQARVDAATRPYRRSNRLPGKAFRVRLEHWDPSQQDVLQI